jgi:hypothetical protein
LVCFSQKELTGQPLSRQLSIHAPAHKEIEVKYLIFRSESQHKEGFLRAE